MKKLCVLQQYKMRETDLASVLEVDLATLSKTLQLSASERIDETGKPLTASHEFQWDQSFEFLLQNPHKAVVSMRLVVQSLAES